MNEAKSSDQLKAIVTEAESAVSTMKDPQLKATAMAEIMRHLLAGKGHEEHKRVRGKAKELAGGVVRKASTEGPLSWIQELKEEGFFKDPKTSQQMLTKLAENGHHLKLADITWALRELPRRRGLRRTKRMPSDGKRLVWHYSNW